MAYLYITLPATKMEEALKTKDLKAYVYYDYWEFNGGKFINVEEIPAGTLTVDTIKDKYAELNVTQKELIDEINGWAYGIYVKVTIGYFDEERDYIEVYS